MIARETWFATVSAVCGHWGRIDERTIWLRFFGYKTAACYEAEERLLKLGGFVLSLDFDSVAGQTVAKVREPRNLEPAEGA